jgi:hypothetical protein
MERLDGRQGIITQVKRSGREFARLLARRKKALIDGESSGRRGRTESFELDIPWGSGLVWGQSALLNVVC